MIILKYYKTSLILILKIKFNCKLIVYILIKDSASK